MIPHRFHYDVARFDETCVAMIFFSYILAWNELQLLSCTI